METALEQSLPMPGGSMPASERIIPYQGGTVRQSPEAQVASRASSEFTQAFGDAKVRKNNRLDPETQGNLDELQLAMRHNRPQAATVINLHPFDLQFNADNYLLRGHQIPACHPGQPYSHKAIRGWRHDGGSYNENGSRKFKPILPIDVAGQFVREFNLRETFGPGVLIYLGDSNPDKVGLIETYDPKGRLITVEQPGIDYDSEDKEISVIEKVPVKRQLTDLLKELRADRNDFYLSQVQLADDWARQQDGKARRFIQKTHRLMAEVLHAEGIIPVVPEWSLSTKVEKGFADENCPSCQSPTKLGAYKCMTCNNILDALAAFKDGEIQWGHAKLNNLPDEKFAEAEAFHGEQEKRNALREKKAKKEQK